MGIYQVIRKRRSIRRFKQKALTLGFLKKVVNAARLAPSGANLQPLEYICVNDRRLCVDLFKTLAWAGYISPRGTPAEGERPVAYVLVLANTLVRKDMYQYDVGAAIENMILTALDEGIGACWISSINRTELSRSFNIPSNFVIDSVLALGYPDENPMIEKLEDSCKYWKDAHHRLHVPKRDINSIVHINKF